jgi:hypothetical protein
LSRAGHIYKSGISEKEKTRFRIELFTFVSALIHENYKDKTPNDQQHLGNILKLMDFASSFGFATLRFGHAQKVLNLFLKYQWCLGYVQIPPHFPVDRLIQKQLGIQKLSNWTDWTDHKDYIKVIEDARIIARKEKFESIAELELSFYNNV